MVLPGMGHSKAVLILCCVHELPLALWCTAIGVHFQFNPTLLIAYNTPPAVSRVYIFWYVYGLKVFQWTGWLQFSA